MICFAWDRELSSEDLLDGIEDTGLVVDSRCFSVNDPADNVTYNVVAYDRDDLIEADEEMLKRDFLALLNTVVLPCGV
jgi:hypothetical protein